MSIANSQTEIKPFLTRLPADLLAAVEAAAHREARSVNRQIEWMLRQQLDATAPVDKEAAATSGGGT